MNNILCQILYTKIFISAFYVKLMDWNLMLLFNKKLNSKICIINDKKVFFFLFQYNKNLNKN
jgi:hypothetical protein